jgi:hypothetical protein
MASLRSRVLERNEGLHERLFVDSSRVVRGIEVSVSVGSRAVEWH